MLAWFYLGSIRRKFPKYIWLVWGRNFWGVLPLGTVYVTAADIAAARFLQRPLVTAASYNGRL
jgi:hypothetical protein